ncbi:MAG TPA: MarR family transcriptional regulator [Acidimicrobiia bacterium]
MAGNPTGQVKAWRELMHVHARVTSAIDETLRREVGISGAWYEALVEIALAGGAMKMNQFAEETTLTRSGATRFVDRLEEAGLVERVACPTDRRVFQLELTGRGKEIQMASDPHVLAVIEREFASHISDAEAETVLAALRRTRSVLSEA